MKYINISLILVVIALLFYACAQQVPLTGGPKDEVPPQLDTLESIDNHQIHFEKQDIILNFDEFVNLRDAAKQILISPPPDFPPIIDNRLKEVSVKFDEKEILKEETTYVINFGESITDYTEGNKLQNFTFVFSTGDFIDSLSLKGEVRDAFTGEPVEEMVVMLYINHQDSVVYKEKPYYFARSDKDGNFKINNLRSESFKIVAIGDLNLNYTFDSKSEQIGFLDSLYLVDGDTTDIINLEVFKEVNGVTYKSFDIRNQGEIDITFDPYVDLRTLRILDSIDYYWEYNQQNEAIATLWYAPSKLTRLSWETMRNGSLDTISARINLKSIDTIPGPIKITGSQHDKEVGLHPIDTLVLNVPYPIKGVDGSRIVATVPGDSIIQYAIDSVTHYTIDSTTQDTIRIITQDTIHSIAQDTIEINWINPSQTTMQIKATYDWEEEEEISIQLLPGAITDLFDKTNDTSNYDITIAKETAFADIELQFENFDSSNYIIQLLEKEKLITQSIYTPADSTLVFEKLNPKEYNITIIEDKNNNGRWDPGNYLQQQQSERIYRKSLGAVQAGSTAMHTLDLSSLTITEVVEEKTQKTTPRTSRR